MRTNFSWIEYGVSQIGKDIVKQETVSGESQFWRDVKEIFLKWERLRLFYNLILLIIFLVFMIGKIETFRNPALVIVWFFEAIGANICFFAAPITESYAYWLGVKGRRVTIVLFVCGILVSIPLVIVSVLAQMGLQ